jgi:hypothetical protein
MSETSDLVARLDAMITNAKKDNALQFDRSFAEYFNKFLDICSRPR